MLRILDAIWILYQLCGKTSKIWVTYFNDFWNRHDDHTCATSGTWCHCVGEIFVVVLYAVTRLAHSLGCRDERMSILGPRAIQWTASLAWWYFSDCPCLLLGAWCLGYDFNFFRICWLEYNNARNVVVVPLIYSLSYGLQVCHHKLGYVFWNCIHVIDVGMFFDLSR